MGLLHRFLRGRPPLSSGTARVPLDLRAYAVGDIHGRLDLLRKVHESIAADAQGLPPDIRKIVIYLGDYVDRGFQSKQVIDFLLDEPLRDFEPVYLKGNHEACFMQALEQAQAVPEWLRHGGDATVFSYGLRIRNDLPADERFDRLRRDLLEAVPERHREFLSSLELSKELGDYLFVHAGVDPFESLPNQLERDLLWIRDEFLDSASDFGKVVVHGHSVSSAPDIRDNRIGIDTGAYISGTLTCVVLEGSTTRFLSTTA